MKRPVMLIVLTALALAGTAIQAQQQEEPAQAGVRKTTNGAPDRNGNGQVDSYETYCPPFAAPVPPPPLPGIHAPKNHAKDADRNDDGKKDYFMGEYEFVQGTHDMKVTKWCIDKAPADPGPIYHDYFTYEISVSENGVYKPAVAPNHVPDLPEYPIGLPRAGHT